MNNLSKLLNRMPRVNSKSHKAKEEKRKLLTAGVVSCCKCGDTHTTLFRFSDKNKSEEVNNRKYICKNCKEKMERKQNGKQ